MKTLKLTTILPFIAIFFITSCGDGEDSTQDPPPIRNTDDYANASVMLPKDWNGKYILIDAWEWIWCAECANDYTGYDEDPTYYKYPLSPNVIIEAGIWREGNSSYSTQRMTVNEFADYMRSLPWAIEGGVESGFGIVANVTYENKMITRIRERYTP